MLDLYVVPASIISTNWIQRPPLTPSNSHHLISSLSPLADSLTLLHRPCSQDPALPFLCCPSGSTWRQGHPSPSLTVNLHCLPVSWQAPTNFWLATSDSAWPDALELEVSPACHVLMLVTGSLWGGGGGCPGRRWRPPPIKNLGLFCLQPPPPPCPLSCYLNTRTYTKTLTTNGKGFLLSPWWPQPKACLEWSSYRPPCRLTDIVPRHLPLIPPFNPSVSKVGYIVAWLQCRPWIILLPLW